MNDRLHYITEHAYAPGGALLGECTHEPGDSREDPRANVYNLIALHEQVLGVSAAAVEGAPDTVHVRWSDGYETAYTLTALRV